MYYSIPEVHQASVLFKDVDYSDITRRSQEGEAASKVSRRTRVSFECHPSVILEEIMGDEFDEEQEFDEFDLDGIFSMLAELSIQERKMGGG